jgi:hypothetical protein
VLLNAENEPERQLIRSRSCTHLIKIRISWPILRSVSCDCTVLFLRLFSDPFSLQFFGAPAAAPAPQAQPAPVPVAAESTPVKKESWEDEEKAAEAAPVVEKAAPAASSSSSSSAPAQPTTSKFVIEDDDIEDDGPEDGEPTVVGSCRPQFFFQVQQF